MRRWLRPTLPRLVALVATAWIAFWACAPVVSRPVVVGHDLSRDGEFGLAGGVEFSPPETDVRPPAKDGALETYGGQFHIGGQITPVFYLDLVGGLHFPEGEFSTGAGGLGLRGRFTLVNEDRFFIGVDAGLGFLYAQLGVPIGFRLGERVSLWTAPSFALAYQTGTHLPLGITLDANEAWDITLQTGVFGPLGAFDNGDYAIPRFPMFMQVQHHFPVNRGR